MNSGHRGAVDREEQWAQRNSEHRRTVDTEEYMKEYRAFSYDVMAAILVFPKQRNGGHIGVLNQSSRN